MQEVIDQILEYLKGIWIKRRYIMISTWLICPFLWIVISQMDDIYKSEARVYADTQSILGPLLKGLTVETNPDYQIQLMVKTLLSRPNLERITRMTDLDVQAETPKEYEELISKLHENIEIRKTGGYRENLFNISYVDKNTFMAQKVVQSVLTVFIENTLGENRTDADSAQSFLTKQIKDYENRLLISESRLTDFKQKYSEVLPGESGGYYMQLRTEREKLEQAQLELDEVNTSLISAKQQLAQNSQKPQKTTDNITDSNSVVTAYDERIKQLATRLDDLLLRYTEQHPDVKEAQNLLMGLRNTRKSELEEYYASLDKNKSGNSSNLNALNINPVFQEINIQVNQLENKAASLKVRVNSFQDKVKVLESKIHILPEIEAELTALNRDYEITKDKYEDLLNRRETALIAKKADETTNKIQFKVIDPPRAPTEPAGPRRILYLLASTILGIGVGVGLSLLTSQINPVVTSSSQITKETGIPVFGVIAATENLGLQQWHKRKTRIFVISNLLLMMLLSCFIAFALFPDKILAPLRGML